MHFPIPGFKAEEAAKDAASDCRALAKKGLLLREAVERKEANANDLKELMLIEEQIRSYGETVFVCEITGDEYQVRDYLTPRREMISARRAAFMVRAIQRLRSFLMH